MRSIAGTAGFDGVDDGRDGDGDADRVGDGDADGAGDDGAAAGGAPCGVPPESHPVTSVRAAATATAPAMVLRTAPPPIKLPRLFNAIAAASSPLAP
jgi:hypothetical protein